MTADCVYAALLGVCEARHRRVSEERHSVSIMTFVFLTMLAIFTFYGVAFLQMGDGGLIVSVVSMTGLSLLMAMAVLADTGKSTALTADHEWLRLVKGSTRHTQPRATARMP